MNSFTTQATISQKTEVVDSEDAIQYLLIVQPTQDGVAGEIRITITDPTINAFFTTGDTYDVTITPHAE